jgi:hypothetical protein
MIRLVGTEQNRARLQFPQVREQCIQASAEHGMVAAAGQAISKLEAEVEIPIDDHNPFSA